MPGSPSAYNVINSNVKINGDKVSDDDNVGTSWLSINFKVSACDKGLYLYAKYIKQPHTQAT